MRDRLDAETIAKGLSPARQRAVLAIGGVFGIPPRGHAQWLGGMSASLVQWRYSGGGHRQYRLTPLGLAVRAILKGE